MVILADIVIFAALTLKRPAHTRKDDVLIAVNVAIDALTAIRHVAFDVNTLVTYAEHDGYIPIIRACECLAYLHSVLDLVLLPLSNTILFTTALERYFCIMYADRYAYSGASCTFNIHVLAVLLAIPAAAYELSGPLLSSAMNYSTAPLSRDPEKAQVTAVTALVLASYILLNLFPEFVALPQSNIEIRWIAAWVKLSRGVVNAIAYLVFIQVSGRHSLRSLLYRKKTSSTPVIHLSPPERRA
ncbi:hypothetical protein AAVH_09934 [Aphelenchoides avenae]|nr:hypothetical protein AAVH_09934 [Aphelenchus avenae]